MLYNPPSGSVDPNAPYSGKNPTAGTQGSKVPRFAIEGPQREIVNVLLAAGIGPSNGDLTQLLQAIRILTKQVAPDSALVHGGIDTGTVNAIVANVAPDIGEYTAGFFYVIKARYAPTGPTVANLDGRGNREVRRADGTPIKPGDWGDGEMILLADDGAGLRLQGVKTSFSPPRNLVAYTAQGPYMFVVPAGVFWIYTELVGAGGGGAGGAGGVAWSSGGGGSGGYASGWIPVVPGQSIPLVVGAKGLGGGNGNGAKAGNGGTTTLGSFMQATGGEGGVGGAASSAGGSPGIGSGGQKNFYGSSGGDGNITSATAQGGQGGASAFGGGGRTSTLDNSSTAGLAPGSGGGGIWGTASAGQAGGPGADGAIFIQY